MRRVVRKIKDSRHTAVNAVFIAPRRAKQISETPRAADNDTKNDRHRFSIVTRGRDLQLLPIPPPRSPASDLPHLRNSKLAYMLVKAIGLKRRRPPQTVFALSRFSRLPSRARDDIIVDETEYRDAGANYVDRNLRAQNFTVSGNGALRSTSIYRVISF